MNKLVHDFLVQRMKLNVIKECMKAEDMEYKSIFKYLCKNSINEFNYDFVKKYKARINKIYYDDKADMKYVIHNGKQLYFKRSMSDKEINSYYNAISLEQDKESPHLYMTDELCQKSYRCVLDIGAAEGNFALDIIERVEEIYIIEADAEWVEALEHTFESYKDKVHIINSFVSDKNEGLKTTIDQIVGNRKDIDLIKIDVEGVEISVLKGSQKVMNANKPIYLVCAYHYGKEEDDIRLFFENYKISARKGYMVFLSQEILDKPLLRRGVLEIESLGEDK